MSKKPTKQSAYKLFQVIITAGVITGTAGLLAMMYVKPGLADTLSYEDGVVEWLSAAFLIAASIAMIITAIHLFSKRYVLQASIAVLISLLFFVIAMEEISWGQRILGIESSQFFLENNKQREMNFHNLNTNLTEKVYYIGAFTLLVVLPFFRKQSKLILKKLRLNAIKLFLPAAWLFLPFTIIAGLTGKGRLVWFYVFAMFAITMVLLGMRLSDQLRSTTRSRRDIQMIVMTILVTIVVALAMYVSNYFDYSAYWLRTWMITEWAEMFIAVGIFAYATSLFVESRRLKIRN
jgi:hypothetical protein